jgi:putative tryptophan/tyrosine transport system substrate-binding protein
MRRRTFIAALGGAAAWPVVARAQQPERTRRIGVLMNLSENDSEGARFVTAFRQGLQELGWADGSNVRIDTRWTGGDAERFRKYAADLVGMGPDVILAATTPAVIALRQATRIVPIVFVGVIDPVGSDVVATLARPGGNATGFILFEFAIGAKWLELLKEIAPRVTRAAVLRDATIPAGVGQFAAIQTVASTGMELGVINLQDAGEIEHAMAAFAQGSSGGLIVTPSPFGANNPEVIVALAARYKLPTVYPFRYFVSRGGLISYGPDLLDPYRRASGYVDRILKGEKSADLPVQAPTKYELVINLKTAKALGLQIPTSLLARADEVIE